MKVHAAALGGLLLLSLAAYGFLLRPGQAPYTPFSDFLSFGLASKTVLYESLRSGQGLPLWRSDQFSGNAALIDPQNAYTSPLNALFWLLPPLRALGPSLWLYFFAAGAIGYAAGCALEAGLWARLLMGATAMFQFKLIVIASAGWLPSFPGVIVLPLLYAAVLRAVERPRIPEALWLGLAGALCLHSGHLQLLFYSVLALTCLVAPHLRSRAVLAVLLAGMVLAAGLSACLLIPLAGEAPLISRGQASYDFFLGGHALTPRHLLTLLRPELLGNPLDGTYPGLELWEDAAYFGIIPLALALAAAVLGRRRPLVRALTAALLVCAALSLRSPLQRLLFETLPGFSLFRLPGRLLFLGSWFGIALAGLGLDEILARLKSAAARRALALTLVSLISIEGAYYARRYLKTAPIERLLPAPSYRDFFAEQKGVYRIVLSSAASSTTAGRHPWPAADHGLRLRQLQPLPGLLRPPAPNKLPGGRPNRTDLTTWHAPTCSTRSACASWSPRSARCGCRRTPRPPEPTSRTNRSSSSTVDCAAATSTSERTGAPWRGPSSSMLSASPQTRIRPSRCCKKPTRARKRS